MSNRQKSFFDQNKPKQFQGQWNRRNGPGPPHNNSDAPPPRQAPGAPPIAPGTHTKKKLKAFQFVEGEPTTQDMRAREAEKENIPHSSKSKETPKVSKVIDALSQQTITTPKLGQSKSFPPPSTPLTRLPLAELVGNEDDSRRHAPKPVSPEEQLIWRGSQPVNTPGAKKRKRARSSSPVSASQDDLPIEHIKKANETPVADPAAELWNRYTNNKGTPLSNKAGVFAHLINDSSPRSSTKAGSVGGLRRWASCGVEFPTSASKKRRTNGAFRTNQLGGGNVFNLPSSDSMAAQPPPEKSKLADMVQRMRESMPKPLTSTGPTGIPSSSSPLPDTVDPVDQQSESPTRERLARSQTALEVPRMEVIQEESQTPSTSSDEFGGADLDDVMVEALDMSQAAPSFSRDSAPIPTEPFTAASVDPPRQNTAPALPAPDVESDDEFGLDDEDEFAADLEFVASLYDSRPEATVVESQAVESQPMEVPRSNLPPNSAGAPVIIDDDSDDEFGDDIDVDAFAEAEQMATQGINTSPQDTRAIQRYLVKSISEDIYTSDRGYQMPEKILLVEEEKTKISKTINLRQAWYDTPCTPGSFVHVIGQFNKAKQCVIDDSQNMLILHPDHLISATVVADSFSCLRRAVLQDRIKATSQANAPMLYGTLLHELFQEALKVNRWDSEFLSETIDKLLPGKFETILEIGASCEQVKEHMSSKLPELQAWAKLFVRAQPQPDAIVRQQNGRKSIMSINKLLDVEEHVWSPMYGLKGNVDATVQVILQDDQGQRTLTVPFEVKTGKNSSNASHVAQTALYNLLLSNRYDVDVAYGILYYLETSDISRIPTVRNEIIHMIIKRNELACFVRERIELPPMLKEDFKCGKCYAQTSCFLYDKLVEDGNGELLNTKAKERYDELVMALKPSDQEFMKKWDTLLTKEESDMMKFRRELWTMLSTEREKLGRCFSNVILEPGSAHEVKDGQKINRFSYIFIKQMPKPGFSFTESQLIVGEPVVVSDEEGHFALANGYVTSVRKHRITVAVDRRLHNSRTKMPGFDSQSNQTFAGIMEVGKEGKTLPALGEEGEPVLYRLDKDEFSNGMAAARNNLIQIMDDNVFKARDLRSLIVNLRAPTFKPVSEATVLSTQAAQTMNADQKAAVAQVMSAKDYALVLGMPGTGKTTTIAHLIRALVAKGKSVLLTSYTHTAVDNILLKFKDDNMGILRLGAAAKVHPDVREFAILDASQKGSLEELEQSWMEPPIVATTCLSINHPLFNRRVFDYCIVDEASQITLPVCLGPIRLAKTFILVGDHFQLPPLVQNKEAQEGGLDVSLFKMLCEAHPQAVVSLRHQYRMCEEIMLLSNTFIYSGRLKCGTPSVASRRLALPTPNGLQAHHHHQHPSKPHTDFICRGPSSPSCWLSHALSPSNPVIFINTDLISPVLETQSGSRITNALEARLITHLTLSLLALGISASEIGIIAFYRSQLALLRQSLATAHTQTQSSDLPAGRATAGVELHTADKFQGRDKEVVLVSCVRSNENQTVGDLLKDQRRINVALTRARSKLVILGSEKTLAANDLLRDMVGLCRQKGWVLDVTLDMVDGHAFDEGVTQTEKFSSAATARTRGVKHQMGSPASSQSPVKKRRVLGDVTTSGAANKGAVKKTEKGLKTPVNGVFRAGKRGVLEGRPVLRDVFNGAM